MKYCPYCGKQIDEQDVFCRFCGEKLPKKATNGTLDTTEETKATTVIKVVNEDKPKKPQEMKDVSIWWGILGFFIPLVGLIVFLDNYHSNPARAKICGIPALVGFLLNLVITFMYYHYWYM